MSGFYYPVLNVTEIDCHFNKNLSCETVKNFKEPFISDWVSVVLFCAIMILSLSLNSLVLMTIRHNACLRKLHDLLIMHFSVFNIITVFGIPVYILFFAYESTMFTNKYVCLLGFIPVNMGTCVVGVLLLALAIERFLLFKQPFLHRKIKRKYLGRFVITVCVVILTYLLLPVMGWNEWEKNEACVIYVFPRTFILISTIVEFFLVLTNLVFHGFVLHLSFAFTSLILREENEFLHHRKFFQRNIFIRNARAIKTVFYLAVISSTCWLPGIIVSFLYVTTNMTLTYRRYIWQTSVIFHLSNTAIVPIVFGLRNRHFRSALKGMLCYKRHECVKGLIIT